MAFELKSEFAANGNFNCSGKELLTEIFITKYNASQVGQGSHLPQPPTDPNVRNSRIRFFML